MKFLKRVFSFNKECRLLIALLLVISIIYIPIALYEPKLASSLTSKALSGTPYTKVKSIAFLFISFLLIRLVLDVLKQFLSMNIRLTIWKNIRKHLFNKLLRLQISYFDKTPSGYILSRQSNDSEGIEGLLPDFLLTVFTGLLECIIIFILIFQISWQLSLITILLLVLIFCIQYIFPLKKLYKKHTEAKAGLQAFIQYHIDKIALVKSTSRLMYHENMYINELHNYIKHRKNRDIANIMRNNISKAISYLSQPLVLLIGLLLIANRQMDFGSLVAYTLYQTRLFANVNPIISAVPLITLANVSFSRIFEILDLPEETTGNENFTTTEPSIDIVDLQYECNDIKILKRINLNIQKGEFVALVGSSGSGKSTILKNLIGFARPNGGNILINNTNTNQLDLRLWRRSISYMSQSPILFNNSIRFNLSYGNPDVNEEVIISILHEVNLADTILKLPEGLDTILDVSGGNFSGGEQQRLCLARELLRDTQILLLDEATSALDKATEIDVLKTIKNNVLNKCCIFITHRLELLKEADRIVVMSQGRIIEEGTFAELNKPNKHFYFLLNKEDVDKYR